MPYCFVFLPSYLIRPCNTQTESEEEQEEPMQPLEPGMSSEHFPLTTAM